MLNLVFAEQGPGPTQQRGPFAAVRIDGEKLRGEPDGAMVAEHQRHTWVVGGRSFFRVDCDSPVRLYFENANGESSPTYGPFLHFSSADGIAYGDGMVYGSIDLETKLWYSHRDGKYWRDLVVRSAAAPPA